MVSMVSKHNGISHMPPIADRRPPTADGRQSNRHNGILHMSGRLKGVLSSCGGYPLLTDPLLSGIVRGNRHAILRDSTVKHKNGHSSSHRASQKLSIGSFGRKFRGSPYEGIGMRFYDMKHQYSRIPSDRASPRLSIDSFGRKFRGPLY